MGRISLDGGRTFKDIKDMTFGEYCLLLGHIKCCDTKTFEKIKDFMRTKINDNIIWKNFKQGVEEGKRRFSECDQEIKKAAWCMLMDYDGDIIIDRTKFEFSVKADSDAHEYVVNYNAFEGCDVNLSVTI